MGTAGYLRVHDCQVMPDACVEVDPKEAWPPELAWFASAVQVPYLEATPLRACLPPPVNVLHDGHALTAHRLVVVFEHLALAESFVIVGGVDASADDFAVRPDIDLALGTGDAADELQRVVANSDSLGEVTSLVALCDATFTEATGVNSTPTSRTGSGIVYYSGQSTSDDARDGIWPGDRMLVRPYLCVVSAPQESNESLDRVGEYLILTSVRTRGRHLMERVRREVNDVARNMARATHAHRIPLAQRIGRIQADAIVMREEASGEGFLNKVRLKAGCTR